MLESIYNANNSDHKDLTEEIWLRKRKKVMIIDDDIDYRLAISEMLVDQGYSVTTAKDGEMGLNSLIHERDLPDLILVDLMMPIKGGLEFRREQSQLDEINKIPVVFVTGHGYIDGELCLQKPFMENEILGVVRRYINS